MSDVNSNEERLFDESMTVFRDFDKFGRNLRSYEMPLVGERSCDTSAGMDIFVDASSFFASGYRLEE